MRKIGGIFILSEEGCRKVRGSRTPLLHPVFLYATYITHAYIQLDTRVKANLVKSWHFKNKTILHTDNDERGITGIPLIIVYT